MSYREYRPHPALAPHVACLWTLRVAGPVSATAPHVHRVLPDNCIDILWQDGGTAAFAVGMMSASILVPASRPVRTVGVRFKPGAAGLFLGLPLAELTDTRAGLADLWGSAAAARLDDALWTSELADAQRVAILERELLGRLALAGPGQPTLALRAVAAFEAAHGDLRIESVAERLGVSRQHFALQFRQQVGLSPKLFARICRFRRALALLREPGRTEDMTTLAADCGYFDQSHLIRDFHDFANAAPGGL
ncbi:helix-turn-helix protein [Pseudoduganella lurida]|uniref:Helix-turn-helix protein n=1 Tax=Pseudoduganella lurida TaxID=1036180 RepID=A0A562QXQ1_9BURK|nr:helix-turn-helix transcriptional regulator [Pseudoduganella lurida]TWI61557.1 helix-turn-helix protein [Pseudoduganella lurida]